MNASTLEGAERELHPFMSAASRALAVIVGLALIIVSVAYFIDWVIKAEARGADPFALALEAVVAPAFGIAIGFILVFLDGKD